MKCPKCNFDNENDSIYCGKCGTALVTIPPRKPLEFLSNNKKHIIRFSSIFGGITLVIYFLIYFFTNYSYLWISFSDPARLYQYSFLENITSIITDYSFGMNLILISGLMSIALLIRNDIPFRVSFQIISFLALVDFLLIIDKIIEPLPIPQIAIGCLIFLLIISFLQTSGISSSLKKHHISNFAFLIGIVLILVFFIPWSIGSQMSYHISGALSIPTFTELFYFIRNCTPLHDYFCSMDIRTILKYFLLFIPITSIYTFISPIIYKRPFSLLGVFLPLFSLLFSFIFWWNISIIDGVKYYFNVLFEPNGIIRLFGFHLTILCLFCLFILYLIEYFNLRHKNDSQ